MEEWRILIARFNLTERISLPGWSPILNFLAASLISRPKELALWSHGEVSLLANTSPEASAILGLHRASVVSCHSIQSATPESSRRILSPAHSLAASIRVSSVEATSFARQHSCAASAIDLHANFSSLGPAAKIRRLAESTAPREQVMRFLNTGAQVNILRQVQDSLKPVAPGIQCYASCCDLLRIAYFPPATETVLRLSTLFAPGRSFAQYLSHLSKACSLMNLPLTWITPSVRGVAKGLANAHDVSFRFDNFIQKDLFLRLIRFGSPRSEIGRLFYLSYLFLLRVPYEGIPIRRALSNDVIIAKSPQSWKALMCLRPIGDSIRLVFKLKKRKLNKTGAIMIRPCFCDGDGWVPTGMRPAHDFWPIILRLVVPGALLFPLIKGMDLNRILKAILGRMGIESAEKYPTKASRRGTAMDIMASGSTLAQIMRSAGWRSQAFRAYLIFQMEGECNTKAIFASSGKMKQPAHAPRSRPRAAIPSPIDVSSSDDSDVSYSSSLSEGGS